MLSIEKPGTPSELIHFGKKGMKWGVRNESSSSTNTRPRMSNKKKAVIGVATVATIGAIKLVGVKPVVVAAGAAFAVHTIKQNNAMTVAEIQRINAANNR